MAAAPALELTWRVACWLVQIDKSGRIIDLEANKAKLSIIEQEFKTAEKEELLRLEEEEEMRVREAMGVLTAGGCGSR